MLLPHKTLILQSKFKYQPTKFTPSYHLHTCFQIEKPKKCQPLGVTCSHLLTNNVHFYQVVSATGLSVFESSHTGTYPKSALLSDPTLVVELGSTSKMCWRSMS